jgi:hypothetical protein
MNRDPLLRKVVTIREGDLSFDVRIQDVKSSYGVKRYLVTPVRGSGEAWINSDRVTVKEIAPCPA